MSYNIKASNRVNCGYNLERVKCDEFMINRMVNNFNKLENKIYEANRLVNHVYHSNINLRILALNVQRLNKNKDTEAGKKIAFIKDEIAYSNCDIFFLIDVGEKVNEILIPNYKLINDGRNLLAIKTNIKLDVLVKQNSGYFEVNHSDLRFVYVRPNEDNVELVQKVVNDITRNKCVIGDVNLKSNKDIANAAIGKKILGEQSGQTVMIQKKVVARIKTFLAPSDHKGLIIDVKKYVPHNAGVMIEKLDMDHSYDLLEQIFEKGTVQTPIKFKSISRINHGNEEERLTKDILQSYLENDMGRCYKCYENWWKKLKKEPFLGCEVPKTVEDSLRAHYKEDKNKQYHMIPLELLEDIVFEDLDPKNPSYSRAKTNELIALGEVDANLALKWSDVKELDDEGNVIKFNEEKARSFLENFIKAANDNRCQQSFKSFFLRKNKNRLELFHDVRIIVISPIFMKIWECLIYEKVVSYLGERVNSKIKYQHGGVKEGSTYFTILDLQKKYYKAKGKGVLFIDIAKGYDSVNWTLLRSMINGLPDASVKSMLLLWYLLLVNIDVDINQSRIKKGRGLGMGLTLAPVMFVSYVDEAIIESGIDKDRISMYVDDLAMVLSETLDKDTFVKLVDTFKKYDMEVNSSKCAMLTIDEDIKKTFSGLGIMIKNSERYLGVELSLSNENSFKVDNRFCYIKREFLCLPKVMNFAVKRLIYHGAVLAKLRYTSMMFAIKHKTERMQLLKLLWMIFKMDFPKLSYLQLTVFTLNYFRFFLDLFDLEIIIGKSQKIQDVDERKKWTNDYIISKCVTGIDQLDEFIVQTDPVRDDPKEWKVALNKCSGIADSLRRQVIDRYIIRWKKEKKKDGKVIYEKMRTFAETKYVLNCKTVELLLFHHYDEKDFDLNVFIMLIMAELGRRIKGNKDITKDYTLDFVAIPENEFRCGLFLKLYYNYRVMDVYKLFDVLMEIEDKKEYKEIRRDAIKVLCWLDVIYTTNRYKNKSLNELLYAFNLKLAINLNLYDTIGEVIDRDNALFGDARELKNDEVDNIFSVDGSFSNQTKAGGAGIVYKTSSDVGYKKAYFKVPTAFLKERNVAGELLATLWAIEKAIELKLKDMILVFDYVGNFYYSNGLWTPKSKPITLIVNRIRLLLRNNSSLYIKWFKADSHTNLFINDEADRLSKIASGIEKPMNDTDKEVSPPVINV